MEDDQAQEEEEEEDTAIVKEEPDYDYAKRNSNTLSQRLLFLKPRTISTKSSVSVDLNKSVDKDQKKDDEVISKSDKRAQLRLLMRSNLHKTIQEKLLKAKGAQ